MKILLGILCGILIATVIFWSFRKLKTEESISLLSSYYIPDSKGNELQLLYDEKITALNKRLDDLLVFGGIIITLLLGINAGIFVNTERQVDAYLRRNYGVFHDQIRDYVTKAENLVEQIRELFYAAAPPSAR